MVTVRLTLGLIRERLRLLAVTEDAEAVAIVEGGGVGVVANVALAEGVEVGA